MRLYWHAGKFKNFTYGFDMLLQETSGNYLSIMDITF